MKKNYLLYRSKETIILENTLWPHLENRKRLAEGLIITHPIPTALRVLNTLGYKGSVPRDMFNRKNYISINGVPVIPVIVLRDIDISNEEKFINLLHTINLLGYYVAQVIDGQNNKLEIEDQKDILKLGPKYDEISDQLISIAIEAKYDVEIDNNSLPEYLYHTTLTNKVPKIKKMGLSPKSGEKMSMHPSRIYVATSELQAIKLAYMMSRAHPEEDRVILKIDTSKLRSQARFFVDPNADEAIYTYINIPPNAISVDNQ